MAQIDLAEVFYRKRRRQIRLNVLLILYFFPLVVMVPLMISFVTYRGYAALLWLLPFILPAVLIVGASTMNWRCPRCRVLLGISLKQSKCHACHVSWTEDAQTV